MLSNIKFHPPKIKKQMPQQDIRWLQRLANYKRAFAKLEEVVGNDSLSELEIEGLIQRFEYTHELAWNVMKDYLKFQGNTEIGGSRDATREAFKINLIENAQVWMNMIKSRNQSSHTYDQDTAHEIFMAIVNEYYPLFLDFKDKMEELKNKNGDDIFSEEL